MKEFKDYSDEEQKYIQKKIDEITEETDPEKLSNNMDDLILEVSSVSSIGEGDTTINLEGPENKIELLSVILDGLDQLSDKEMFYNKIINSNELDEEITKYFEDNKEKFFEVKETEKEENVETPEKIEDPETVTEETKEEEKTVENNSEGTPETINEDKQENTKDPDEKINKYIEVTEQMEKELEEEQAKYSEINNSNPENDYLKALETLKNSVKENDEIRNRLNGEPFFMNLEVDEERKQFVEDIEKNYLSVQTIGKEIESKEQEIELLNRDIENLEKYLENTPEENIPEENIPEEEPTLDRENTTIQERLAERQRIKEQRLAKEQMLKEQRLAKEQMLKEQRLAKEQMLKEQIEERDKLQKEVSQLKYKRQIEQKSAKYLDSTKIRDAILAEVSYTYQTINAVSQFVNGHEKTEDKGQEHVFVELQANVEGSIPHRLNSILNELFETQKIFINAKSEINVNKSDNSLSEEIKKHIEKTKHDIEERKNNIRKYKEIDEEIKGLVGKELTDEEKAKKEEEIKNKINTITDDGLKEELTEKLNKALGKEKDPEKKEPTPIPPGPVKKDPKKWHRYMGRLGLVLGGAAALLIPGGFLGALAISAGVELANAGYTAYKVHQKRKQEKELAQENEITNISKIEKVKLAYERLKKDIKELNENDKWFKNITWLLHGAAIGSLVVGIGELLHGGDFVKFGGTEPIPEPVPQHEIPNIKVGDSATGLDMSTGYDTSNWAINGTNAESLNQGIMNDGNTVIRRIMDAEGKTYMSTEEAYKAGKTLQELSLDLASNTNLDRAFVNAGRAIGR